MLWYLLYPFRGTTDPPVLSPTHPIRKAFTSFGRIAARHPVTCISISVALSTALIYPFFFLYTTNLTNGTAKLPTHEWQAVQPFEGPETVTPVMVVRPLWVHGDYMKALNPKVLQTALQVQDKLLGSTMDFDPSRARDLTDDTWMGYDQERMQLFLRDHYHASNGMTNQSWFFQSPLQYWSGSHQTLLRDDDVLTTVNRGAHHSTKVNVTLRHSVVFSGKRFEDNRLVAADALVITLVHKPDSPVGRQWEREAANLAITSGDQLQLFPKDGRVGVSQLYECRIHPLSLQDNLVLGLAYVLTALYLFITLRRLRAVKSRTGLTITILIQLALSVMSSFTICGVLKIDLSKIPHVAYPLLVGIIGIENMFRLITAVLSMPAEMSPSVRLAEALGRIGHITLAKLFENLIVLWMFYHIVSPSRSLQALILFSAIALTLDFIYLLTFFVSVLSVDVLRTELRDSLDRATSKMQEKGVRGRKTTWLDGILQGDAPISTHVAGSVVMVGFLLLIQRHFFADNQPLDILSRIQTLFRSNVTPQSPDFASINQARSQVAWLQLQSHESVRQFMKVVAPGASSIILRIYDPLAVVLNGSDRTPTTGGVRPLLPAAYDFLAHRLWSFVITILIVTAAVSLLMKYLLWDEDVRDHKAEFIESLDRGDDLHATTIGESHKLDVTLLAASTSGVVVTFGLDGQIGIWHGQHKHKSYMVRAETGSSASFSATAIAVDESGRWLALASTQNRVVLWDIEERRWEATVQLDSGAFQPSTPLHFAFEIQCASGIPNLVVVDRRSTMYDISFHEGVGKIFSLQICKSPLIQVQKFVDAVLYGKGSENDNNSAHSPKAGLITVSRRGCVHVVRWSAQGGWNSEGIENVWPKANEGVRAVVPLPAMECFLAVRDDETDLISLRNHERLHTFESKDAATSTVRALPCSVRRIRHGVILLTSFSLIYTNKCAGKLVVTTYSPKDSSSHFSVIRPYQSFGSWPDLSHTREEVSNPGIWDLLPVGVIVGIRRRSMGSPDSVGTVKAVPTGVRRRPLSIRHNETQAGGKLGGSADVWEAWSSTIRAVIQTIELENVEEADHSLRVGTCGPLSIVNRRSLALSLGNLVKVITVGDERHRTPVPE